MNRNRSGNRGFSLVEIIVVISIMAVLGGVLVPSLLKQVNTNRATACKVDREAILAVYERCIYADTKKLETADLDSVLKGEDLLTKEEVRSYYNPVKGCPGSGLYDGEVQGDTAIIHCDHAGHEDVAVDFLGWAGTEEQEKIDAPLPPPPSAETPEVITPTTEEPSSTEPKEKADSLWPYADILDKWVYTDENGNLVDNRVPGGKSLEMPVPSGLFTSREGNQYVIVDTDNTGLYIVEWEKNRGPEYINSQGNWGRCIPFSGVVIRDLSKNKMSYVNSNYAGSDQLTGIRYGDIILYEGVYYIYTNKGYGGDVPINPPPGNGSLKRVDPEGQNSVD